MPHSLYYTYSSISPPHPPPSLPPQAPPDGAPRPAVDLTTSGPSDILRFEPQNLLAKDQEGWFGGVGITLERGCGLIPPYCAARCTSAKGTLLHMHSTRSGACRRGTGSDPCDGSCVVRLWGWSLRF